MTPKQKLLSRDRQRLYVQGEYSSDLYPKELFISPQQFISGGLRAGFAGLGIDLPGPTRKSNYGVRRRKGAL